MVEAQTEAGRCWSGVDVDHEGLEEGLRWNDDRNFGDVEGHRWNDGRSCGGVEEGHDTEIGSDGHGEVGVGRTDRLGGSLC